MKLPDSDDAPGSTPLERLPQIDPLPKSPVTLSIAGSDSGGGAGIQADLRAFNYFRTHGTTALTAVTAQNPHEVQAVFPLPPDAVRKQLEALYRAFDIQAVKTGMLHDRGIIHATANFLNNLDSLTLVVDPVMIATSGARLLENTAVQALKNQLLPLATVVTPNLPEAEILGDIKLSGINAIVQAATDLANQFGTYILIKGGHRTAATATDILSDGSATWQFVSPLVYPATTHGTGCMLSSAIAANLACGEPVINAIRIAKSYIQGCLENAMQVGPDTFAMSPPPHLPSKKIQVERIN